VDHEEAGVPVGLVQGPDPDDVIPDPDPGPGQRANPSHEARADLNHDQSKLSFIS